MSMLSNMFYYVAKRQSKKMKLVRAGEVVVEASFPIVAYNRNMEVIADSTAVGNEFYILTRDLPQDFLPKRGDEFREVIVGDRERRYTITSIIPKYILGDLVGYRARTN